MRSSLENVAASKIAAALSRIVQFQAGLIEELLEENYIFSTHRDSMWRSWNKDWCTQQISGALFLVSTK